MSPRRSEAAPVQERPDSGAPGATAEGVTDVNPFPGPRPFAESEGWLFFGRERELSDLVALLFAQRAVLLHGPSGGGKSSLVHAGMIPRARARGFEFLPVARVRGTTVGPDEEVTGNRYLHNVIENWRDNGLEIPPGRTALADVLGALPPVEEPGRVIVFDQFEEIFVVHPESWKDRADLLLQVQAALDGDPLLHVVFVLRDDYLARLQPLTPLLRDRLSTRYALRGLSSDQALDAVVRPFAASGRSFAPGVAEALVKAIRAQPGVAPDAGSYEGEDVEPVQLQIVCRTFFDRLPPDVTEIGAADVERHADVGQALVGFYEQALAAAVKRHTRIREAKVRQWFERQLITPARTRGIVFRDQRTTAGLANEMVDELEARRVVRSEPRGPATWYELPHDRLVDAVLTSNRAWFASRSRTITRISAALGVVGVLSAVVSLVLLNLGGDGSDEASALDPERYEISVPGQVITRRLGARAGQEVTALMRPQSDQLAGELRLLDGRGTVLAGSRGIESTQVVLTVRIPADGEYQLVARGQASRTGEFDLDLLTQSVDATGATLPPGRPVPGEIGAPDEVDVYAFSGPPGAVAQLTMAAAGDLLPTLVLTGPANPGIADRQDQQAALAFVIPQDGTYEVRVSGGGRETGSYRLDLELVPADAAPAQVTGTLDGRNSTDVRAIRSEAGGIFAAFYAPSSPTYITLLRPDGRVLASEYIGDDAQEGQFGPEAIAPGLTYLVMVEWNGNPLSYSLSLEVDEARPLVDGQAAGELAGLEALEAYRVDAALGDISIFVRPQTDLDLFVSVMRPDGTVVQPDGTASAPHDQGGAGEDELFTVRVEEAGRHLVVIGSYESGGHFELTVTQSG